VILCLHKILFRAFGQAIFAEYRGAILVRKWGRMAKPYGADCNMRQSGAISAGIILQNDRSIVSQITGVY